MEAVVKRASDGICSNAVFAGNSSGNSAYQMGFGGTGTQADQISSKHLQRREHRDHREREDQRHARAAGSISGGTRGDRTDAAHAGPPVDGLRAPQRHQRRRAVRGRDGPVPEQLVVRRQRVPAPRSEPGPHLPQESDRATNINSTAKDDYFLEDVYEAINTSSRIDPAGGSHITVSGVGGEPGRMATTSSYYIDGNLWIHNMNARTRSHCGTLPGHRST
jgi:hypothetical protein